MTDGARSATDRQAAARRPITLRIRVRLRRRNLDRRLAAGADPGDAPELAARASHLTSIEARRAAAVALDTLITAAGERRADPASPLQIAADEVDAARDDLASLAVLLRSEISLTACAAAQVSLLVYDRRSPVYRTAGTTTIPLAVARIFAAATDSSDVSAA